MSGSYRPEVGKIEGAGAEGAPPPGKPPISGSLDAEEPGRSPSARRTARPGLLPLRASERMSPSRTPSRRLAPGSPRSPIQQLVQELQRDTLTDHDIYSLAAPAGGGPLRDGVGVPLGWAFSRAGLPSQRISGLDSFQLMQQPQSDHGFPMAGSFSSIPAPPPPVLLPSSRNASGMSSSSVMEQLLRTGDFSSLSSAGSGSPIPGLPQGARPSLSMGEKPPPAPLFLDSRPVAAAAVAEPTAPAAPAAPAMAAASKTTAETAMAIDAPAVATTTPGAPVAPGVVRPSTAPCPVSEPTTAASGPEENACLLLVSLILSVPVARPAVRRVLDDLSHFPSGLAGLARRMVGRLSTVLGMDFNLPTALLTVAHRHFVNLVSPAWNWLLYPLLGEAGPNGPVTVSPALASLYSELAGLLEPLATIPLVGRGSETTPDAERPESPQTDDWAHCPATRRGTQAIQYLMHPGMHRPLSQMLSHAMAAQEHFAESAIGVVVLLALRHAAHTADSLVMEFPPGMAVSAASLPLILGQIQRRLATLQTLAFSGLGGPSPVGVAGSAGWFARPFAGLDTSSPIMPGLGSSSPPLFRSDASSPRPDGESPSLQSRLPADLRPDPRPDPHDLALNDPLESTRLENGRGPDSPRPALGGPSGPAASGAPGSLPLPDLPPVSAAGNPLDLPAASTSAGSGAGSPQPSSLLELTQPTAPAAVAAAATGPTTPAHRLHHSHHHRHLAGSVPGPGASLSSLMAAAANVAATRVHAAGTPDPRPTAQSTAVLGGEAALSLAGGAGRSTAGAEPVSESVVVGESPHRQQSGPDGVLSAASPSSPSEPPSTSDGTPFEILTLNLSPLGPDGTTSRVSLFGCSICAADNPYGHYSPAECPTSSFELVPGTASALCQATSPGEEARRRGHAPGCMCFWFEGTPQLADHLINVHLRRLKGRPGLEAISAADELADADSWPATPGALSPRAALDSNTSVHTRPPPLPPALIRSLRDPEREELKAKSSVSSTVVLSKSRESFGQALPQLRYISRFQCCFANCSYVAQSDRRFLLVTHLRKHFPSAAFKCPICSQSYRHSQSLRKHMRRAHDM
ncbi:hypothetical protein H696_03652 [Fonticula alba]|uniref:C2H2-type domain-containing protein n=1 Tax=Fonticula alba TaxID=691883 RepID=A0A058Z7B7_FONAL|nr:hypothetical protein H696_03652 [Fonticula alba]KCV70194.1 hypothetical protein H696_03652 [Fonticula alba]|eukprot:XP_009495800.1 hypothetical protein H696_03652 [Fonticula alba]